MTLISILTSHLPTDKLANLQLHAKFNGHIMFERDDRRATY